MLLFWWWCCCVFDWMYIYIYIDIHTIFFVLLLYSIFDLGTRRGWGVSITPRPHLTSGKIRYPLYRRLGGPQGRSGQVRKISPPPGCDPRTVQPVGSLYTDYATRSTYLLSIQRIFRLICPSGKRAWSEIMSCKQSKSGLLNLSYCISNFEKISLKCGQHETLCAMKISW
jgi:hypothetical protein